jgi:hypothetical protein
MYVGIPIILGSKLRLDNLRLVQEGIDPSFDVIFVGTLPVDVPADSQEVCPLPVHTHNYLKSCTLNLYSRPRFTR